MLMLPIRTHSSRLVYGV